MVVRLPFYQSFSLEFLPISFTQHLTLCLFPIVKSNIL